MRCVISLCTPVIATIFPYLADFGSDEIPEFGRRVSDRFGGLSFKNHPDLGILQGISTEAVANLSRIGLRRAGAREQAEPIVEIEIFESLGLGKAGISGNSPRAACW